MKSRIEPFQDGLGATHYRVISETPVWSAARRVQKLSEVVNDAGFAGDGLAGIVGKGKPFDPAEEPWPSDKAATWAGPPNCEGDARYGQEPTQAGQALAHAMHTAAEGGEGCDSVACSITQGVSD